VLSEAIQVLITGKVILGTTHIIICATVAKDGDASAAKLEDEKG
jgi:hypothetical protein